MSNLLEKRVLRNNILIILGALSMAVGVVLFLLPNTITTGGTPGMGILLHHISGISIGVLVFAINLPLIIWGGNHLGREFAVKTIFVIFLISIFIDILAYFSKGMVITDEVLLASIFGGIFIGLGLGLIFKAGASAGGFTIVAKVLESPYVKPAQIILVTDVIIVLSSIFVFNDIEKALWSIISIYFTAKTIDIVLTGTLSTKVIHITSLKADELSHAITDGLGVKGTVLEGENLTLSRDKKLIFLVLDVKRLPELRCIIKAVDKDAFMIVMEASEMLGRGH
jgi:uncharacterized membrane-anchored protein YitT (DUF2179 family)